MHPKTANTANSPQLREERKKGQGAVLLVGLTQILPVSIPTNSLLVSGLKDIQEHDAGDTKKTRLIVNILFCLYE